MTLQVSARGAGSTPHGDDGGAFVLLDDSHATAANPTSRLYTGLLDHLQCTEPAAFPGFLEEAQAQIARGRHLVLLMAYELGPALSAQPIAPRTMPEPLAQALAFGQMQRLSSDAVSAWLQEQDARATEAGESPRAGIADLSESVAQAQFGEAIDRIRAYIRAGDSYQVNYTYRLHFDAYGSPIALYRRLRARQPVPYGALVRLPGDRHVLSLSPELFVRHQAGQLTAQPMKGTAAAAGVPEVDAQRASELASDPKSRAENVMIVDLLRNDLGRVAQVGSVRVPALFEVERFGDVLQMTSTVQAQLAAGTLLHTVLAALYPCGSITGAPKLRTQQIIRELEPDHRGLYTGAIGWIDAPAEPNGVPDFCLSVPIRTLELAPRNHDGVRRGRMGIGAGILADSQADDEFRECRLKGRFLSALPAEFQLIETLRAEQGTCVHLAAHLARLARSARYFDFSLDAAAIEAEVRSKLASLTGGPWRVRLLLAANGTLQVEALAFTPSVGPVRVALAPEPLDARDIFLRHKTTVRARYNQGLQRATALGLFDLLHVNRQGRLTEGCRSNVFVRLDGRWYTPPVADGALPGVMRAAILSDARWGAVERSITRDELARAQDVMVCNALHGPLLAQLSELPAGPTSSAL